MKGNTGQRGGGGRGDRRVDRRTFVKGAVGAAVAGVGAATWYAAAKPLSPFSPLREYVVRYIAAKKVGGPAPRGLPLLPVRVADDGTLEGRPSLGGESVLDWYKYCGHEGAPGLRGDWTGGEALRYFHPHHARQRSEARPWYADMAGEPARAAHFDAELKGAAVTWRSPGDDWAEAITAVVIRADGERVAYEGADAGAVADAGLGAGFLAFVTFCTHFCATVEWPTAETKDQFEAFGAEGHLLCLAHLAEYDPFTLTVEEYTRIPDHP